ncbi:hypothetical protein [Amycolatopsis saalfeldensis]|uniref:hypothetical protein n=1 Tax=Amycolatopsis saalfeldensis TaxID=394193 RepID=UPI0015A6377F|nr:hypothetical protein [Amycolatopsis saalfeldensis]
MSGQFRVIQTENGTPGGVREDPLPVTLVDQGGAQTERRLSEPRQLGDAGPPR